MLRFIDNYTKGIVVCEMFFGSQMDAMLYNPATVKDGKTL